MRRVPLYLQSEAAECGLACLAMVAGTYQREIDLMNLRTHFRIAQRGLTLRDIADLAISLGFITRGVRTEPNGLKSLRKPAILHWQMNHFVVLVSVRRRGIVIHDPNLGRVFCVWAEVDQCFTGVVLEVWPGAGDSSGDHQGYPRVGARLHRLQLFEVVGSMRDSVGSIVWVCVLTALLQVLVLVGPWHVQWTVDQALTAGDLHLLSVLAIGFALLVVLRSVAHWLRGSVVIHLGHELSFQLACGLLQHLLRLPLNWFEHRHVGDVISRFASLTPIRDLLTQGVAAMLVDGVMLLVTLVVMAFYNPVVTLLVVGVHLLATMLHLCFVPRIKRLQASAIAAQAAEETNLLESVRAMRTVKTYSAERVRQEQWQRLHSATIDFAMRLQNTYLHTGLITQVVGGIELVVVVYLLSVQVLNGNFTVGMLYAYLAYRSHFTQSLQNLVGQFVNLRTMRVHLDRLAEIWRTAAESDFSLMPSARASVDLADESGPRDLTLADASFAYGSQSVLRETNLKVNAGEFLLIVGASGAGKSTLLKLLMALADPSEGELRWGDQRVFGPLLAAYRSRIASVLQEDQFFKGSIASNVTMFEPLDEVRLTKVLSQVGLRSLMTKLPMGYRTEIGDIASGFSSGELQRLYLARALYKQPDYLFFDEGTANLDPVSASIVQGIIARLECTRIVVSHDMHFAVWADRVVRLEEGQLIEVDAQVLANIKSAFAERSKTSATQSAG